MGKNGKFGKDYGRVVGKDSKSRPGWKGPGYVKKADKPQAKRPGEGNSDPAPEFLVPIHLQQLLVNVFRDAFPGVLNSDGLLPLLQDVKSALYERDFQRAFGKDEHLEAYAIRWSPSRALCYLSILVDLRKHLAEIFPLGGDLRPKSPRVSGDSLELHADVESTLHAACFGGGAAEVIAFGGFLYLQDVSPVVVDDDLPPADNRPTKAKVFNGPKINLLLLDVAQWQDVVHKLQHGLTNAPPLSKYASSSAKDENSALVAAETLATSFRVEDVLELNQSQLGDLVGKRSMLLTLLFTLNELYTASVGKATAFLLNLTSAVKPGSLLLVVDSPGSYSATTVGTDAKKYPMHWLLDHTLLETQTIVGQDSKPNWVKVVSEDSCWFRLPENLHYAIPLENMRYQVHLYRRL